MAGTLKGEQHFLTFNAGEVSQDVAARMDVEKIARKAALQLVNAVPIEYGAAKRRPGFRFVARAAEPPLD